MQSLTNVACLTQEGRRLPPPPQDLEPEQAVVRDVGGAPASQGAQHSRAVSQPGFSLPVTTQPAELSGGCGLGRDLSLPGKT